MVNRHEIERATIESTLIATARTTQRQETTSNACQTVPQSGPRHQIAPNAEARRIRTSRPRVHGFRNQRTTLMGLLRERMEGYGEPGGSPRFREEGGGAEFAQDRNSLARIPVAEMRAETWFPPRTRAEAQRCRRAS